MDTAKQHSRPDAPPQPWRELLLAAADDLRMLATLNKVEPDEALLEALRAEAFPDGLGLRLESSEGLDSLDLMRSAVKALPANLSADFLDGLAADFADIYLNHTIKASPEESVWIDEENLVCQEPMFQVRKWYGECGLTSRNWRIMPDDHLVLELEFVAHLCALDSGQEGLNRISRFMDEHLLRWLMPFAKRVAARCGTAYFAGVVLLTGTYCEELRDLLVEITGIDKPSAEELEARMKPRSTPEPEPMPYMPGVGPAV